MVSGARRKTFFITTGRTEVMVKYTVQTKQWSTGFGQEYTDRNLHTSEAMDCLFKKQFGLTLAELNLMLIFQEYSHEG